MTLARNTKLLAALFAFAVPSSLPVTASAADTANRFGVKGAGAAKCEDFIAAYDNGTPLAATFGGWIDGFITATNHYHPNVFDVAPWQSSDVLAYALSGYCRTNKDVPFHEAMLSLRNQLVPQSLTSASPAIVAQRQGKAVVIYAAVLQQVREKLVALGKLSKMPSEPGFDAATSQALVDFQKERGLAETGLPDHVVLSHLLGRNNSKQAAVAN